MNVSQGVIVVVAIVVAKLCGVGAMVVFALVVVEVVIVVVTKL